MLVKRKAERDRTKYVSYIELKQYVRQNNILSKEQYINHVSKIYIVDGKNIPYNQSAKNKLNVWNIFRVNFYQIIKEYRINNHGN